ncbi:MAG TPA: ABC transporter substrate-binding protein [Bryobacteraceae bacterium]|nr:ABC transporter substrate-binding protein [Bryobacteraceae bacterium]
MHRRQFFLLIPAALLAACSKSSAKLRLALNWKPEPEFGGFYATPYSKYGLDVEILPGGAGTPTVQMVGAGSAEFGLVEADELVVARARGNDVVGLFAVFQDSPLALMVHASRKLASIGDIFKGGTVAMQRGLPYARLIEKQYSFDKVKIVPSPGGDLSSFLRDPMFAQQVFVTAEFLTAKRQGSDAQVFPVSLTGFNPYSGVVATSGDSLRKNPEIAKAMVAAMREGWRAYLDDPKPVNQRMNQLNPSMALDVFAESADAQKPFIENDQTRRNGLGTMTRERWQTLIAQLKDLGDIQQALAPEDCFKNL